MRQDVDVHQSIWAVPQPKDDGHQFGNIDISAPAQVQLGNVYYINHGRAPTQLQRQDSADLHSRFWVPKAPTKHFTGREDQLASIRRWFLEEDNRKPEDRDNQKIVVIQGMGGLGKTQLALKFAYLACNE